MINNVGIVGYGAYLPKRRISVSDIAKVWGKNPEEIVGALNVREKTVAGYDEDAVTMAVAAGRNAISMSGISPRKIGALFVGSESHPYAVNPSSTTIAEALGFDTHYLASDLEFACKAGTSAIQIISALLGAKHIDYGLAIGSDTAQAKPHDVLEYTASAGSAAYLLGRKVEDFLVEICDFVSFSSDTPDFWRRDGIAYPSHQGRFTGEPAYFAHVIGATKALLQKTKTTSKDFDYAVFHMPNGKFPIDVATRLGFKEEQVKPGLVVTEIGNSYSASSLLGLAALLEKINGEKLILLTSYGSGAGADSFMLKTTDKLKKANRFEYGYNYYLKHKKYITYPEFLKLGKNI